MRLFSSPHLLPFLVLILLSAVFMGGQVPHVTAMPQDWHAARSLPQPLAWFGVTYDGHDVLVIGGRDATGNPVATVYRASASPGGYISPWKTTRALPKPLLGHAATRQGNHIYVLGGWSQGNDAERAVYYTPSGSISWRQGDPLPVDLYQGAAAATSTHLYYIGGYHLSQRKPVNTIFMADFSYDGRPVHWRPIRSLPKNLYRHTAFIYRNRLYVIGGYNGQNLSPWVYDAEIQNNGNLGTWRQTRLPIPREYAQALFFQNHLIILGGRRENGQVLRGTYLVDITSDGSLVHWRSWTPLPRPLYQFGALIATSSNQDTLFILGGRDETKAYRAEGYHSDITAFRPRLFLPHVQRHPTPTPTPTLRPSPTPTPTPTPVSPQTYLWWQEAEAGHPVPPIGLGYDQTASACRYLKTVDDFSTGGAKYTFRVPASGQYMLWARVKGMGYASNSWNYSLDEGQLQTISIPQFHGQWTWDWMSLFGGQAQWLSPGKHTLQFFSRENETGLDAVLVTGIPGYVPHFKTNCPSIPAEPMGLVNDGSFENGPPPSSAWEEHSNTECEWIGSHSWNGVGPYHGQNDFWAGGYCQEGNQLYAASTWVRQLLYVPTTDPTLYFHYLLYRPDSDDTSPEDYAYVQVNGVQVWRKNFIQANNTYPSWVAAQMDLSAYAGQIIELKLGAYSKGELTGNIRYDYIQLGRNAQAQENRPPSGWFTPTDSHPSSPSATPSFARTPTP